MSRICPHCNTHEVEKGSYCKDCARILTIYRQQKFKAACVEHMREGSEPYGTCHSCRQQFEDAQLCLRHKVSDPTNIKLSRLAGSVPLKDRVLQELAKCELLCHNCEREKYRSTHSPSDIKLKALNYLGGVCNCGVTGPTSALEFHHKDPNIKTIQLGNKNLKHWDQVAMDLAECEIICANCHSLHHAKEKKDERDKWLNLNVKSPPSRN